MQRNIAYPMEQIKMEHQLCRSPSGRLHIGTASAQQRLMRPDGQPVAPTPGCREPVFISVYDLHWTNRVTKRLRLAAYHTGLEVYGVEIAFGDCGVFRMRPKDVKSMECAMTFKKSVQLGYTDYKREDVLLISEWLGRSLFAGTFYDLLRRNCNHFSATFGQLLCPQAQFPSWINSLANVGSRLPFIERRLRKYLDNGDQQKENHDNQKPAKQTDSDLKLLKQQKQRGLKEVSSNLSQSSCSGSIGPQKKIE